MLANWLDIIGRLAWWVKRPAAGMPDMRVDATGGQTNAMPDDDAEEPDVVSAPEIARVRHRNFLLAARLSSVARQNVPSTRAVGRLGRNTATNRPVSTVPTPVKVATPQAWIAARSRTTARSKLAADIVEMRPARAAHRSRRTTLALAA